MRLHRRLFVALMTGALGLVLILPASVSYAQIDKPAATGAQFPVIKGYGPIRPDPDAALQPVKGTNYKVVFDLRDASGQASDVSPGLAHVARFVNLMYSGGIQPQRMDLAVVVHGAATPVVLKNEFYRQKFGADNPNLALISSLRKNGVKIYVCSQALMDYGFANDWVNPDVTRALGGTVAVVVLEAQGYSYLPI